MLITAALRVDILKTTQWFQYILLNILYWKEKVSHFIYEFCELDLFVSAACPSRCCSDFLLGAGSQIRVPGEMMNNHVRAYAGMVFLFVCWTSLGPWCREKLKSCCLSSTNNWRIRYEHFTYSATSFILTSLIKNWHHESWQCLSFTNN